MQIASTITKPKSKKSPLHIKSVGSTKGSSTVSRTKRALVGLSVLLLGTCLWVLFKVLPHRPPNVPKNATPVSALWGYDWDYCWFDMKENASHCQIFNRNGDKLYDDIFLPYEGNGPTSPDDLKIKHDQHGGGEEWIYLQNGTILIPRSSYGRIKNGIDWQNGKRATRN